MLSANGKIQLPGSLMKRSQDVSMTSGLGIVNTLSLDAGKGTNASKPSMTAESRDLNDTFREFCKNLANSKLFMEECEEEFESLITNISLLDSSLGVESNEHRFQGFSKSLLKYLDPDNEDTSEEIQLMGLRICRKFVESAVPETTIPGADWNLSMYSPHLNELKRKQKKMEDIGIFSLISKLLKTDCSKQMKMETILLCISLLLGGSLSGQMTIYKELVQDKDNKMLASLKELISSSFEVVKSKMVYVNDRELNSKIYSAIVFDSKAILQSDKEFLFNLSLCTRIYKLLQLFCEGHNLTMQNLLRKQSESEVAISSKDINFIGDTCFMLGPYLKFCNIHTRELGEQIFDFLIDSVQGPCYENQKKLFNSKLIDFGKDFLNDQYIDIDDKTSIKEITDETRMITIVKKVIKLMLSLFEGHEGAEFSSHISTINFDYLIGYLTEELIRFYFKTYSMDIRAVNNISVGFLASYLKDMVFDDELVNAFEIYFFINIVNDISGVYTNKIRNLKGTKKLAFDFFKTFSNHIEIVFRNNLQRVYFVIQPACLYLSDTKQTEFLDTVNRDTPNDKLAGMMEVAPELFDIMDHLCYLSNLPIKISPKIFDLLRLISLITSFTINIIIFTFFKKSVKGTISYISDDFNEDNVVMNVVGLTHVTCGILLIILWGIIEGPIVVMNGFREKFRIYRKVIFDNTHLVDDEQQRVIQSYMSKNMRDITHKERMQIIGYYNSREGRVASVPFLQYTTYCLIFLLQSGMFKYLIFYLTSSIVALTYNVVLLYAFHLLDVINRFQTLQNVIKAITYNKTQLILTTMLGLLIIYIYALFAYYFVNDTFYMSSVGDAGENVCTTVIQCLLTVISLGPRSSGSIGDVLLRQSFEDSNKIRYYIRWVYDFTCFAVINIIFMNIIFGIIIDTFAELRDQNNTKENDMNNVCFICSFDRHKFENKGDGFEHHVKIDHNPWNYIYFLYNIKRKDPTEYNGVETFVREKLDNQEIGWIPVMRAMVVPDEEDFSNNLDKQIEIIMKRMEAIKTKIKASTPKPQ
jgi:inositol 1,4,5-triphosphate receptor type 3